MKKHILTAMAALTMMTACTTRQNPFLTEWNTPYGIPPFDEIQIDDYVPAVDEAIRQQEAAMETVTSNSEAPTFENTIQPLETASVLMEKVAAVLFNLSETDQSPELDSIVEIVLPKTVEIENKMAFNKPLYERVAAIYKGDQSGLTREQQMVVKQYFENFEHNGVGLSEADQKILGEINTKEAEIIHKIGNNILAENNKFKEKFGVSISEYPNAMTTTEDRALRLQMNEAYTSRCHHGDANDNQQLIRDLMSLRIQQAKLLGFDSPAAYTLDDKMAKTPATVDAFLQNIMTPAVAKAKEEIAEMQKIMNADIAAGKVETGATIQPWDWWYYAEKVRHAKYDLNEDLIKPYFKLENVVKGVFLAAHKLYGLNFEQLDSVPCYHPGEVTTYKVSDADGSLIAIFTTDYMPRSTKRGGAWMNNIRSQYVTADGEMVRPIIVNVCNLEPQLNIDEVQTVFHEFGHALHGMLSQCHYASVSGTSVKRDFVEMFSQINENWAFQPALLAEYAFHSETGEVIPDELVAKINNSLKFNQGFMTTELCAASILDMKWHELTDAEAVKTMDIDAFEKQVCAEMGLIPEIAPRYRSTYFNHIFGGSGYNAGYYGYLWAEVLDKDAFSIFVQSGDVFNPELAQQFRKTFLERGGSEEPMTLFRSFTGREPDNTAFLRGRGLIN